MEPKSWLSVGWLPTWLTTQKTALPTDRNSLAHMPEVGQSSCPSLCSCQSLNDGEGTMYLTQRTCNNQGTLQSCKSPGFSRWNIALQVTTHRNSAGRVGRNWAFVQGSWCRFCSAKNLASQGPEMRQKRRLQVQEFSGQQKRTNVFYGTSLNK